MCFDMMRQSLMSGAAYFMAQTLAHKVARCLINQSPVRLVRLRLIN